jgi:hypothetical protein
MKKYTIEHVSRAPNGANFASGYHDYKQLQFNPKDTTPQIGKSGNDYPCLAPHSAYLGSGLGGLSRVIKMMHYHICTGPRQRQRNLAPNSVRCACNHCYFVLHHAIMLHSLWCAFG